MTIRQGIFYCFLIIATVFIFSSSLEEIDAQAKEIDSMPTNYTKEIKTESESEIIEYESEMSETETETEYFPPCTYTNEDYEILAHVINGEAEGNSYELKLGVGSVVLNRVADPRFPNTIKEVVFQPGQYACTWDGNYDKTPVKDSYDAALELLENGSKYPVEVIWQANHCQGELYEYYENTYFCY